MIEEGTAMRRAWQRRTMWYTISREPGAGQAHTVGSCDGPPRWAEVDVWRNP